MVFGLVEMGGETLPCELGYLALVGAGRAGTARSWPPRSLSRVSDSTVIKLAASTTRRSRPGQAGGRRLPALRSTSSAPSWARRQAIEAQVEAEPQIPTTCQRTGPSETPCLSLHPLAPAARSLPRCRGLLRSAAWAASSATRV